MKKNNGIIIKAENSERIQKLLRENEGPARVRKGSVEDILEAVEEIKRHTGLSEYQLRGSRYRVNSSPAKIAQSYIRKGIPMATYYEIVFENSKAYLVDVYRDAARGRRVEGQLSENAKTSLLTQAREW